MRRLGRTGRFKSDFKKVRSSGDFAKEKDEFDSLIGILGSGARVPARYRDKKLHGEFSGCRESHVGKYSVVYRVDKDSDNTILVRIGTHAELFWS